MADLSSEPTEISNISTADESPSLLRWHRHYLMESCSTICHRLCLFAIRQSLAIAEIAPPDSLHFGSVSPIGSAFDSGNCCRGSVHGLMIAEEVDG